MWKNFTTDDAMVIVEKAVKTFKPKTINSCWWKLCPDFMYDVTGFMTKPIKEILKDRADIEKKVRDEGFQNTDLRET